MNKKPIVKAKTPPAAEPKPVSDTQLRKTTGGVVIAQDRFSAFYHS